MPPNSLASARSIFEQNIKKNKENGFDKNIFGQKATNSRVVTRRLFAHTKLSDDSSGSQSLNGSASGEQERRGSATAAAIRRKNGQQQAKGQTTIEQRRTELKPPSLHEREVNVPLQSGLNTEKLSKSFNFKDAFARREEAKKRGSISNLAEHLGKLDIKSLKKSRGEADSEASVSSIESHRNRVQLPDFRQSSYVRSNTNSGNNSHRSSMEKPTKIVLKGQPSFNNSKNYESHSSFNSLGSTESLEFPGRSKGQGSSSSLSLSPHTANASLENSSSSIRIKRSTRRTGPRTNTERLTDSVEARTRSQRPANNNSSSTSSSMTLTIPQHLSPSPPKRNSSRKTTSWIRPSAVVLDDDDSCSSSHHDQPFKSVPFTKTVIKRHSSNRKIRRDSNNRRESMGQSSRRENKNSAHSSNSSVTNWSRRGNTSNTPQRPIKAPAQLDPEELALQVEIKALRKHIQGSKAKLAQIQVGEQLDMERVKETKARKLKRYDTEQKTEAATIIQLSRQEEEALQEEYRETKAIIRQLKQENARLHNQNRIDKFEMVAIRSTNRLLEDDNSEVRSFVSERTAQQQRQVEENDHLMHLAGTYQKSILDLEETIDKKEPALGRIKKHRMLLEDQIDILVDFMQKKCSDFELVEELTSMAFDDDDKEGWEDYEGDSESDDEPLPSFIRTSYRKESENDDEHPRSVVDLLIPTSNHSLHFFVE